MASSREAAMTLEWILFGTALLGAALPLWRRCGIPRLWIALGWIMIMALAGGGAVARHSQVNRQRASRAVLVQKTPRPEPHGGYVSSDKCRSCHHTEYSSWHHSYHRTMTQIASPASVLAPFTNVTLELEGESYRLEQRGGEFWVEMPDPDWKNDQAQIKRAHLTGNSNIPPATGLNPPRSWKRVGMVTGSHHFQAYWVPSSRPGNAQFAFPFAWLIDDQRWAPRKDTFIRDPERESLVQVWNVNCIECHSTAGKPRVDGNRGFVDSVVAEQGISCESCHGPGEEHVRRNSDPLHRYKLHRAEESDDSMINPAKLPAKASSEVCGQCHSVKWNLDRNHWLAEGHRFRPGQKLEDSAPPIRPAQLDRQPWVPKIFREDSEVFESIFWPDGVVRVTGREYNGMSETACHIKGRLSCLSCHSMHQSERDDQLARGMGSNEACFQCHESMSADPQSHTHHPPGSSGSLCYNCHMPFNTYGLLKGVRTHHIESPNLEASVNVGRPNGCNLCHLDKTLDWTAGHLQAWYQIPPTALIPDQKLVSAALLWGLRGDAAQRALIAWSMGWSSARETSGERWLVPYLIHLMEDPYSAVRYMAYRSLRQIPGFADILFDYVAPPNQREVAVQAIRERWQKMAAQTDRSGREVLMNAAGELDSSTVNRLLREQDPRTVDLIE
jgi:predicted CXXCH cytochrome family protein